MTNLYKKTSKVLSSLRFLIVVMLTAQPFMGTAQNIPVPDVLYYKFDETGTTVTNHASNPPAGTETATIMGSLTQGGTGQCKGALIGSGISANTDYLQTNWATNLGTSSWTISFWTSNIPASSTLFYIFGDANTNSFRCFTNGVAGANNWILRGGGLTDVYVNGAATSAPSLTTFVYDAVAHKVFGYYNGVQVSEVAQSAPNLTGAGPFKVNGYSSNVGAAQNALLDEFRVYSRALTPAEVMSLYDRKNSATVNITTCNNPFTSPSGKYTWTTSGVYKDTIQNSVCGDSAMTINLTINQNTTQITTQPKNDTVNVGTQAGFAIVATDAGVYQWQVDMGSGFQDITDDNLYSGATTATLTISSASGNMTGYLYRCVATGSCSPVYSDNARLEVTSTPAIVFAALADKTYGDTDIELTATSNSNGVITYTSDNTDVATVSKNANDGKWYLHIVGVGTTNIGVSQAADGIYSEGSASAQQKVNAATLAVSADAKTKVYGESDPALTYTVSGYKYNDNSSIITGSLKRDAGESVGDYTINQNTLSAGNNYSIAYTGNKLTISKAAPAINFAVLADKTYGDADAELTATSNSTGAISYSSDNTNVATVFLNANDHKWYIHIIGAGTANIKASQESDDTYTTGSVSAQQKVNAATLAVSADAKTKVYGESDPALTYTVSGYKYNDNSSIITGSLKRDAGESVGDYTINQNTLSAGNNYSIAYTSNKLTISKAAPAINFAVLADKTYGDGDAELTATSNSTGAISYSSDNTNVATVFLNANDQKWYIHIVGAGTANIKASQESDETYTEGSVSVSQKVKVATLTVAADAKTKVYGQNDPALTYTVTGYKYNDNNSVITGALQRIAGENAGEYAINQHTLAAGNNYSVSYTGNKLTITRATQTITWNQQLAAGCNGNGAIQMAAASSAGLTITYTSGNTTVATVTGNTLTPIRAGSSVITATQEGDANHFPATAVTNTFTYTQDGLVKQHFSDALYFANEDGNYVQWQWYKNGTAVAGATNPYYSEMTPLNGSYYVSATDRNGNTINTCPLALTGNTVNVRKITVSPNPLTTGATANVSSNYTPTQLQGAKLILTDVTGNVIRQQANVTPVVKMQMPFNSGIYILTLLLGNGAKETINVVVR